MDYLFDAHGDIDYSNVYNLPGWLTGAIVVGFLLAVAFALVRISHKGFAFRDDHRVDIVGIYSSSSGVLYSVLLALMTINAWENLDTLNEAVEIEAYTLGEIYRDAEGLPRQVKNNVRQGLRSYANDVYQVEWPSLGKGVPNQAARQDLDRIAGVILTYRPENYGESNIHAKILSDINQVGYYHRKRMASADTAVYPVLWAVVWIGGLINLLINAIARSSSRQMDYLLQGSYVINIGLVIYLIFSLDHPFIGNVSVSPEPFKYVIGTMDYMDSHPLVGL
jgi:hypothetical protein